MWLLKITVEEDLFWYVAQMASNLPALSKISYAMPSQCYRMAI